MNLINEIRSLEAKLRYLRNELESIYELQTVLKAEFKESVQKGNTANPIERFVIRLDEYYEEITQLSNELAEKRKKLWLIVSSFPNEKMIDVITLRVKDNYTINEMAEMLKISDRSVRRYLMQSMECFEARCSDPEFMKAVDYAYKNNLPLMTGKNNFF